MDSRRCGHRGRHQRRHYILATDGHPTGRQVAAAAISGAVAGGLGAIAGPLGGSLALELGAVSTGVIARLATAGLSAGAGAIGQEISNVIDPCHASDVDTAALTSGIGGGLATFIPVKGCSTWKMALNFGARRSPASLIASGNAWKYLGAGVGSGTIGASSALSGVPFSKFVTSAGESLQQATDNAAEALDNL